jgi:hypothetical protein
MLREEETIFFESRLPAPIERGQRLPTLVYILDRGVSERKHILGGSVKPLAVCIQQGEAHLVRFFVERDQVQRVERGDFTKLSDKSVRSGCAIIAGGDRIRCLQQRQVSAFFHARRG